MTRIVFSLAMALLVLLAIPTSASAQYSVGVTYRGELIDGELSPLSGVFALRFALFEDAEATVPLWQEDRFVATENGLYEITLGREIPLPATVDGRRLSLAVMTRDGTTITRHPMRVVYDRLDAGEVSATVRHQTFADLAGYARRAERATTAENCTRLSGRTLAQIDQYDNVLRRIRELQQAMLPGGLRISPETVDQPRIGGDSGIRYDVICPPGFAMTGARGGHGHVVDGFQPICTRIE